MEKKTYIETEIEIIEMNDAEDVIVCSNDLPFIENKQRMNKKILLLFFALLLLLGTAWILFKDDSKEDIQDQPIKENIEADIEKEDIKEPESEVFVENPKESVIEVSDNKDTDKTIEEKKDESQKDTSDSNDLPFVEVVDDQ